MIYSNFEKQIIAWRMCPNVWNLVGYIPVRRTKAVYDGECLYIVESVWQWCQWYPGTAASTANHSVSQFSVKYAGRHTDTLEDRGRQHRQDGTQVQQVGPRTLAGGPQLSHEEHEQEQEGDQGKLLSSVVRSSRVLQLDVQPSASLSQYSYKTYRHTYELKTF